MSILPPISKPSAAWADLKAFWAGAPKHKLLFAAASFVVPTFFIAMFLLSAKEATYKPPEVIFVDNWRADRSDAQIKAQQKIDTEKRKAMEARVAKAEAEKRAYFQSIQNRMERWGL